MLLFKFFTVAGGVLLGLLMLANSLLEPNSLPQSVVKATPKVVVQHDPRASLFERARAEAAAQKAAAEGETLAAPIIVAEPAAPVAQHVSVRPTAGQAQAEPVHVSAPATVRTATATEESPARAVRPDGKKMKIERLRKERLARERARTMQAASRRQRLARERARTMQAASREQNQLYYGYAQQPTYGPFRW
jgi:hypothetical protein